MSKTNVNKTISCNSNGMIISYGDANKHQFMRYETPSHIKKIQLNGTVKYQKIEEFKLSPKQKDLYAKTIRSMTCCSPNMPMAFCHKGS